MEGRAPSRPSDRRGDTTARVPPKSAWRVERCESATGNEPCVPEASRRSALHADRNVSFQSRRRRAHNNRPIATSAPDASKPTPPGLISQLQPELFGAAAGAGAAALAVVFAGAVAGLAAGAAG